jgi:hypothetical protein
MSVQCLGYWLDDRGIGVRLRQNKLFFLPHRFENEFEADTPSYAMGKGAVRFQK